MRSKITRILFVLVIIIISLFSFIFSQKVLANAQTDQLEKNPTLGFIEDQMLNNIDNYFNFDAAKLITSSTEQNSYAGYGGYNWGQRGNICIAQSVHNAAPYQKVTCIMDVKNGEVTVYTKRKWKSKCKNNYISTKQRSCKKSL